MQAHRIGVALLATLLVLAASATASATTFGIKINEPPLVTQRGILRFTVGVEMVVCNVTLTKTLITQELIAVQPLPFLTKLGKVTSGRTNLECGATILNLPRNLGGRPSPGPNPESWDISFLSSNLPGGELNFGILDFQVAIDQLGAVCLYRGALLGTLNTEGSILRYAGTLPLFIGVGCPMVTAVEGTFVNEPVIKYVLLP